MFGGMLKALRLVFVEKNVVSSREWALIVVLLNSFDCMPGLKCLSNAVISFVHNRRVIKVNYMIKSPGMHVLKRLNL